jgi:adenosylhomocysteine nucleosidase
MDCEQAMSDPPKTIGFIFAMPIELAPFAERLALVETDIGGVPAHTGSLAGRDVVAIVTGMGMDYAREGVEQLLDAVALEWVVVVGITGALENETPIGTLIRPEVVVNCRTLREWRPATMGDGTPRGKMWTSDGITSNRDGMLEQLLGEGVVSLDMETAAIAEVCEARGVPWSVFRVISDRASDGTVDDEVFKLSNMDGTPNVEAIEAYVNKYPERIPVLAQMAEDCALATRTASDEAIRAVEMYIAAHPG